MAKLQVLQHDFTAGIRRSRSRDDLGTSPQANTLWNAKDFIIGRLGVPLGKRGGWTYQGALLETTGSSTASYVRAMSNDPFNGGNYMRAIDKNGKVWVAYGSADFATWHKEMDYNNHAVEYNHPTAPPLQNGVFIGDGLFFPSYNGTAAGSTHNEIYGLDWSSHERSGYNVIYMCVWLNRLVGLDAHEQLVFGDPNPSLAYWDPDSWYNLGQPGKGIAALGKDLFVFFDGHIKKVTGTTPAGYGVIEDDIAINEFSNDIGIIDAFSIAYWGTQLIWVDHNGIWASDGNSYPMDLTWAGGAQDLFLEFMRSYIDVATTRVACGVYQNMLFVSMTNMTTNTHIDTLVCDLNRRTWSRMTNFGFTTYVRGSLDSSETWGGLGTTVGRVAKISPIFTPSSTNYLDGDGTPVLPEFETAYFRFGPMDSRIHRLFVGYELEGDGVHEVQDIIHTGSSGSFTVNGQSIAWDATAADAQAALNTALGTGVVVVTRPVAKHFVITWVAVGEQAALTVATGTLNATPTATTTTQGYSIPELRVQYATNPNASPTFTGNNRIRAVDIHGNSDEGYHWKPVPVRAEAGGIAVKVTQMYPSDKAAIHSLGSEQGPLPIYSQR